MSPGPTTQDGLIRALPVLVHIQTHLEADLTLEILAEKANLSPYYFHRIFRSATGETPKQYTQRLRLERAAYHLKTRDASILDIALSAGFRSPETFSRAFKRHFQRSPSAFRRAHRPDPSPGGETSRKSLNRHAAGYEISSTTVQNIRPLPVAFLRNHGPYRTVDVGLYDRLIAWAQSHSRAPAADFLIGIGHDDPNITPEEKLRFDAGLPVSDPFRPADDVGFQVVPGGLYAVTSYTGPYGTTMEAAYGEIFSQSSRLKGVRLIGLPVVEIYRTTRITPDYELNHTDILLPVEEKLD